MTTPFSIRLQHHIYRLTSKPFRLRDQALHPEGFLLPAAPPADPAAIQYCPWADSEPNKVLYNGRTGQRHFPPGLGLSLRALQRMQATTVPVEKAAKTAYRPQNLANSYIVLGTIDPAPHVEVIA